MKENKLEWTNWIYYYYISSITFQGMIKQLSMCAFIIIIGEAKHSRN